MSTVTHELSAVLLLAVMSDDAQATTFKIFCECLQALMSWFESCLLLDCIPACQRLAHSYVCVCLAQCQTAFYLGLVCCEMLCMQQEATVCCCMAAQNPAHQEAWHLPCRTRCVTVQSTKHCLQHGRQITEVWGKAEQMHIEFAKGAAAAVSDS